MDLKQLNDDELLAQLARLVRKEREDTAQIVAHLAEVDSRGLVLERAFPSLFVYCVKELGYTEASAYLRIRAARAARLFPQVIEMLRAGELCLETILRLHPYLDGPNGAQLLESAKGRSKRDVETLVAGLSPLPDRPDFARVVCVGPKPQAQPRADEEPLFASSPAAARCPQPPSVPEPIKRVQFAFTADEELLLLLHRAQEILRHKYPSGRFEDIFRDALIALLKRKDMDVRVFGRLPKGVRVSLNPSVET